MNQPKQSDPGLRESSPSGSDAAHQPALFARALVTSALIAMIAGCSSASDDAPAVADTPPVTVIPGTPAAESPFQELYDQGVDRYDGVFAPMLSEFLGGGVISYTFDGSGNGPTCFTGNPFTMSTRDGASSELMIFLQGGGACSEANCDAVDEAPPGIPAFGILNALGAGNPTANFNVGYVPYCDGTLFSGDRDVDSDGDGTNDRLFRGVQNLSASLDVIAGRYPAPSKILLTGNSAGGFGTHIALPLVRKRYPDVPIELVNDSGVGISIPGAQANTNAYWNAQAWYPASCDTCIGVDGNLTDYHKYQLDQDPNLRMGFLSYTQDAVILERLPVSADAWEVEMLEAMAELREDYPVRFRSMIAEGDGHTFIIRDFGRVVGGVTVRQWITDMLNESDAWVSVSD